MGWGQKGGLGQTGGRRMRQDRAEGAPGSPPPLRLAFPVHRLLHNDPSRSHSDDIVEGGFFCLHKLKQNICEKNNPSPSSHLLRAFDVDVIQNASANFSCEKAHGGFTAFLLGVLLWESRRPGARPGGAEVSAQGRHQLRTEQDSGKLGLIPRQAALPRAGGQPKCVCGASFL